MQIWTQSNTRKYTKVLNIKTKCMTLWKKYEIVMAKFCYMQENVIPNYMMNVTYNENQLANICNKSKNMQKQEYKI